MCVCMYMGYMAKESDEVREVEGVGAGREGKV
jgi:hypothetical protein